MVTKPSKEELVRLGHLRNTRRVIDQMRYTLGLVAGDPAVKAVLGPAFLAQAQGALDELDAGHRDRLMAKAKSKEATEEQDAVVLEGIRYRRALVARIISARHRGVEVPSGATRMGTQQKNPGAVATDLERVLGLIQPSASALAAVGVPADLLKEGQEVIRKLKDVAQRQEIAVRTQHRDAVSRQRELTGVAYWALKAIVSAGQSVHVREPGKAKQYTFGVMYPPSSSATGAGGAAPAPAIPKAA
ncbi:MAG: hypothetical protein HYY16_00615 [Planctomycetes bacterium]|nr:hypothetical protein [Planctomycetota bacterium]